MKTILLIVVTLIISLKCEIDVFAIADKMMTLNGLSNTIQIRKCFEGQQKKKLQNFVKMSLEKATTASMVGLKLFPQFFRKLFNQNFSNATRNCLANCNDVNLLFKHYSISTDTADQVFTQFVSQNFEKSHYLFSNLSKQFYEKGQQQFGQALNKIGHQIYGELKDTQWTVRVQNVEKLTEYFGVTVSNGILGAISSKNPLQLGQTVIGGAYDKMGRGKVDNIVETFHVLDIQASCNSHGLNYNNFVQQLNLKQGKMSSSLSSTSCSLEYEYYALRNLPFGFYTTLKISAHQDGMLQIWNRQQAPSYMNSIERGFDQIDEKDTFSIISSKGTTKSGKMEIAIASSYIINPNDLSRVKLVHEDRDSNLHILKLRTNLKKGQVFQLGVITSTMTSQHHSDPMNEAIRVVIRGVSMSRQDILSAHTKRWLDLWENDIIIEGNDQDQKNVRLMLYHFYSFVNEDRADGISPMGLSGLGYNGHVFWDMDLWMYPGLLALKPKFAKNMVKYRIDRLPAARNNAFINGYKGSMYPWQSSKSGEEQTPTWALSGPLQHHISGCVAFAIWNYYLVTQDINWLRNQGYPILSSVAQFWESRVQLGNDGNYHIKNVVAADQWAQNVDDNAFTNGVAIKSFQIANKANKLLNYTENQKWNSISQKIVILKMSNNVTRQHATYNGQNIKQADVNLLAYPLNIIQDRDQIVRDLNYYETRIPDQGTPAMTFSIFTILYSKLGDAAKSYSFFKQSHRQFLKKPFNVFSQTKGGTNPYFMTGAGGVLQSLIFGFGGYQITDTGIVIKQRTLPNQWKKLTIKGFIKSNQYAHQQI